MRYVLAAIESAFCVACAYVTIALVLFAGGSDRSVPGFMSSTTTTAAGTTTTSLGFHATGGLVLFALLFILFVAVHRAVRRRSRRGRRPSPEPLGRAV